MEPPKNPVKRLFVCVPNHSGFVQEKHYVPMYQFMHQLGAMGRDINIVTEGHTIVHTARMSCVSQALAPDSECTHLLFIDDDMVISRELYLALEYELVSNDLDFLAGLCFSNSTPTKPCIFGRVNRVPEFGDEPWWSVMTDYPGVQREHRNGTGVIKVTQPWGEHRRFRVYASGFGFCLMTRRMLDGMRRDANGEIIEGYHHFYSKDLSVPNEDVTFCINAHRKGYKIYCDSRIKPGHIQRDQHVISEFTYLSHGEASEYMSNIERFRFADDESVDALPAKLPEPEGDAVAAAS